MRAENSQPSLKDILASGQAELNGGRHREALGFFEKALARAPQTREALVGAASALRALGRRTEALDGFRRAARLAPADPSSYTYIGNTHFDLGELDKAENCYQRALALDPSNADANNNIGAVRLKQNRISEAALFFFKAIDVAPRHPDAHGNLSYCLKSLGDVEGAVKHGRIGVEISPNNANSLNNLGVALQAKGDLEGAIMSYIKSLKANRANPDVHANLGVAFQTVGRLAEARKAYRMAIRRDPGKFHVWRYLADITTYSNPAPEVAAMERVFKNLRAGGGDDKHLRFALAKALEDVGRHEESFAHLLEGNRMRRAEIKYDPAATTAFVDRIIASYPVPQNAPDGDWGSNQVFIVGMPRSGTTLIEQALAGHSRVRAVGEVAVFNNVVVRSMPLLSPDGSAYPECARAVPGDLMKRLGEAYSRAVGPMDKVVTNKMPGNFFHVGAILSALPGAKIIHASRNPLDTCLSCFQKLFTEAQEFSYDLAELGRYYVDYRRLMRHWDVAFPGRIFEARYEDMIENPEYQIRKILDFAGLEFEPACAAFHKTKRNVTTASAAQVIKPIYKDSVERWRRFEPFLGPLIHALGEEAPQTAAAV